MCARDFRSAQSWLRVKAHVKDCPCGIRARGSIIDGRSWSQPLSYAAMKERSGLAKKDRTYDAEGFTRRAGCLCFKTIHEEQVLLVTSNNSPDKWIVPAGGVETGEEFQAAAIREVLEEAGVCGNIVRSLGMFQNDSSKTRTMVYVLLVNEEHEKWPDAAKGRRRRWFSIDEAWVKLAHRPFQQSYLCDVMKTRKKADRFTPSFAVCIDSQSKITKDLGEICYKSF